MPIQPVGYPTATSGMSGPYQPVEGAGNAQTNADSGNALAPEDRVSVTSQGLSPNPYDELKALHVLRYPDVSQTAPAPVLTPPELYVDSDQQLGWLPPSPSTELERTLESYFPSSSSSLPDTTQVGGQDQVEGVNSDTESLPSDDQDQLSDVTSDTESPSSGGQDQIPDITSDIASLSSMGETL